MWEEERRVHGRSGREALPRVKKVLAGAASLETVERPRRVLLAVEGRRSAADIVE